MDKSLLKDAFIFLAGLIAAPLAYFIKRRIERRPQYEDLEIKERVLKITKEMKEQNLTPEQLQELEKALRQKLRSRTSLDGSDRVVVALFEGLSEKPTTQFEMSQLSFQDFESADLELKHAYEKLDSIVDPADAERLERAQECWNQFRDMQARFADGLYEGGSIQPMIRNLELQ